MPSASPRFERKPRSSFGIIFFITLIGLGFLVWYLTRIPPDMVRDFVVCNVSSVCEKPEYSNSAVWCNATQACKDYDASCGCYLFYRGKYIMGDDKLGMMAGPGERFVLDSEINSLPFECICASER